jgi:hypothetical protein
MKNEGDEGGHGMPLLVVGIALVVIGVVLLFVKEATAVSKGFGIEVNGPIGFIVIIAGAGCIAGYTWLTLQTPKWSVL